MKITQAQINRYKTYLLEEEKADATVEKYLRDIGEFKRWLKGREVEKTVVLEYKGYLTEKYAPKSVNSVLSSLNSFFEYNEWYNCRVKTIKIQRQIFADKERELTKAEYSRLLNAARGKKRERLYYLMQTICATGIRISDDI